MKRRTSANLGEPPHSSNRVLFLMYFLVFTFFILEASHVLQHQIPTGGRVQI